MSRKRSRDRERSSSLARADRNRHDRYAERVVANRTDANLFARALTVFLMLRKNERTNGCRILGSRSPTIRITAVDRAVPLIRSIPSPLGYGVLVLGWEGLSTRASCGRDFPPILPPRPHPRFYEAFWSRAHRETRKEARCEIFANDCKSGDTRRMTLPTVAYKTACAHCALRARLATGDPNISAADIHAADRPCRKRNGGNWTAAQPEFKQAAKLRPLLRPVPLRMYRKRSRGLDGLCPSALRSASVLAAFFGWGGYPIPRRTGASGQLGMTPERLFRAWILVVVRG